MTSRIYVALDTTETETARRLALQLKGLVGGIKLGMEFFTAQGPAGVEEVASLGMPVFIDLKLHDIPNTVAGGIRGLARLAPSFATIHASGGFEMMKAAADAARSEAAKLSVKPAKILAVTVLTSLDQERMEAVGFKGPVTDQVKRLAAMAHEAGVDGLVCSPHEVAAVRATVGPNMTLVIPGIRPAWSEVGDQKRFMTPAQAIAEGADILVIGRPITGASDPAEAVRRIADELRG